MIGGHQNNFFEKMPNSLKEFLDCRVLNLKNMKKMKTRSDFQQFYTRNAGIGPKIQPTNGPMTRQRVSNICKELLVP